MVRITEDTRYNLMRAVERYSNYYKNTTGVIKMNEEVEIVGLSDEKKKTVVTGIEMFRKLLDLSLIHIS